jgi:hypothetical protein
MALNLPPERLVWESAATQSFVEYVVSVFRAAGYNVWRYGGNRNRGGWLTLKGDHPEIEDMVGEAGAMFVGKTKTIDGHTVVVFAVWNQKAAVAK